MQIVEVHVIDTNLFSLEELENYKFINKNNLEDIENYKIEISKKEKIASAIFENKYIGNYFLNDYGKPLNENIYFNISHSKGLVCFAKSETNIGIDIEKIRDVEKSLINNVTNLEEQKYIDSYEKFFEIWTNKEAIGKMIGNGISLNLKDIPSLPLNSAHEYNGYKFFNKTIWYKNHIITVCLKTENDFEIKIINEKI